MIDTGEWCILRGPPYHPQLRSIVLWVWGDLFPDVRFRAIEPFVEGTRSGKDTQLGKDVSRMRKEVGKITHIDSAKYARSTSFAIANTAGNANNATDLSCI